MYSEAISTLTFISEVDMTSILIPFSPNVLNIVVATPGCERIPTPITDILEILLDELRDYRFYEKDMIHPSDLAVDYIWEVFKENYISKSTYTCMDEVNKLQLALNHKINHPNSKANKSFLRMQLNKSIDLQKKYAFLDLDNEINLLKSLI